MKVTTLAILIIGIMTILVIGINACSEAMDFVNVRNAETQALWDANK